MVGVGHPIWLIKTVGKLNLYEQTYGVLASRETSLSNDTNLLFLR